MKNVSAEIDTSSQNSAAMRRMLLIMYLAMHKKKPQSTRTNYIVSPVTPQQYKKTNKHPTTQIAKMSPWPHNS